MAQRFDNNNMPVKPVSAEQHALNHPRHRVTIYSEPDGDCMRVVMECWTCQPECLVNRWTPGWREQQLVRTDV